MAKKLTVGELRKTMEGVPDELEVHFSSDTLEASEIIIEMVRRVRYKSPSGQTEDYFDIYGNAEEEAEE